MFFRILKNDLRRKKTMNVVLLLFVVLSAMFASSSVNNMIAVYGGIDSFFEKSDMSDYVVATLNNNGEDPAEEEIEKASAVTSYEKERIIFYSAPNLKKDNVKYVNFENAGLITSIKEGKLNYFNKDNEPIKDIEPGHIYVGGTLADKNSTTVGDRVVLEIGDVKKEFVIEGYSKEALFGSPFLTNPRILMNDEDAKAFLENEDLWAKSGGAIYYINTDDVKELRSELSGITNGLFSLDKSTLKLTFMLDMLTAGLLMIVSICLILITFTMLSFTIKFTLTEDFREIGVMKAVGIKNRFIRGTYILKYFFLSVIGAAIGYAFSLPFGQMMLKSVTGKLVIGSDNQVFIGFLSAVAVVAIIVLFCYGCTRRIKKLSPIDAVRNGETGERFNKRFWLRLSKSRMGTDAFMGVNDVVSKPGQYVSMVVTFSICLLLITMLANVTNTLMSEKLLFLFGATKSDVYYSSTEKVMENMGSDDDEVFLDTIRDMEKTLADNDMPGKVHIELLYQLSVRHGDTRTQVMLEQCKATKSTDYVYSEGVAPIYENEVAFTPQILDELDAKVGDKVYLTINGEEKEFIITASLISLNHVGKCGRLPESVPLSYHDVSTAFSFQIDFDDHPDKKEVAKRIEKLKDIFDSTKIYDAAGFVETSAGSASTLAAAKNMVLVIALIIAALITVLMEKSFISKEVNEIALLKALGFKSRSITLQHTLRFVFVIIISTLIAMILNLPFTALTCDRIFALMGAVSGVSYMIKPVEVFVVYPLILTLTVVISAALNEGFL
ncbi:MAG: FtsX-like permease family protein [Lachnospiraceae bacterium]|nr:FtsX-like permease family protein [Lachnospiraceae bacterium]